MTKLKISVLITALTLLTSCQLIKDTLTFKDKTKVFVENLMKKDYDNCISQLAVGSESGKNANIETLKAGLEQFRVLIERNFGNGNFDYSLIRSEKRTSNIESQNTPPNTTLALVEFSNDKEFGVFQVLFDDKSQKIIRIKTLDIKEQKPNMLPFWLFGAFPLIILIFNIYVIRQIKRSSLNKKWLKYVAVILLNVPTISYSAVDGLSFNLLHFEFFGIGFSLMGYFGSIWDLGIPLGGLYFWWKAKQHKDDFMHDAEIEASYLKKNLE